MSKLSLEQKKVTANFLANIGVAWFAAGVISSLPVLAKDFWGNMLSFLWGTILALVFLKLGINFLKQTR